MSTQIRNTNPVWSQVVAMLQPLYKAVVGSGVHYTTSVSTVTADDAAVTLATVLTLSTDIYYVYLAHLADDVAHKTTDAAPALTIPTDQTTANTFLNAVKSDYNTHRASTTYHSTADSTNVVTASNATDLASSITLANDIKAQLVAHIAATSTYGATMPRLVSA